jgi:A/G-specific adenine glycosylase
MKSKKLEKMVAEINAWYASNRRDLPWRPGKGKPANPYHVLVSELMLQQTQVPRVIGKFTAFMERFPTIQILARATPHQVLTYWQGLGYNRRGLYLLACAKEVVAKHHGTIPEDELTLKELPGIGVYTASAIRAFAYTKSSVLIETNVRTVFTHTFFPNKEKVLDSELLPLIEQSVPNENENGYAVREWYYALMDYGAMLKSSGIRINKKSAHYVKQKSFIGSERQVRGALLRAILEKSDTLVGLTKRVGYEKSRVEKVLEGLAREGFVMIQNTIYRIQE